MEHKHILLILGAVIVLILGYVFYTSGPVVSAQGTSIIEVQPDEVSVYISVETRNATVVEAQRENAAISERLIAALIAAGYSADELRFVNFNSYPDYEYTSNGQSRLKGYVVSQQLVVKTDDTTQVPTIVNHALSAGALIQYINFELSEKQQTMHKIEALEAASEDARKKAEAIAYGQGRSLGRLISITNEEFHYPGPIPIYDRALYAGDAGGLAASEAQKAASSITPQDITVTATIGASYKLSLF